MAFKFALEAVLKHRRRLEEVAQREYAEAQAAVDIVLRELEAMYKRVDEVREEIRGLEARGGTEAIPQICESESFLVGQRIRIETTRQHLRTLLEVSEAKQEALITAAREKKVLEKLKDKRLAEHREWLRRVEAKMLDDQAMMARAWGKR